MNRPTASRLYEVKLNTVLSGYVLMAGSIGLSEAGLWIVSLKFHQRAVVLQVTIFYFYQKLSQ